MRIETKQVSHLKESKLRMSGAEIKIEVASDGQQL